MLIAGDIGAILWISSQQGKLLAALIKMFIFCLMTSSSDILSTLTCY